MEEKFIELGGEKLKLIINFKNCYSLTPYRNKIAMGFDLSGADQDILNELSNVEIGADGNINLGEGLSDKTREFLLKQSSSRKEIFTDEDILFILQVITGEKPEKINELLDKEVQENGYDLLTNKMIELINQVFTSAKNGQ